MPRRCAPSIGKCHRHNLERFAGEKLCEPGILLRLQARVLQHRMGSDHQNASQIAIALFKTFGSVTVAAMAVAPITPIPGMVSSRLLASLDRCCAMIRFSIDPIIVCTA